ncbi:MAG: 2-phosphosulfolactate phosphatase [bacterium]|nr:2-phosphosulfolactate phosphatase [bacterium]
MAGACGARGTVIVIDVLRAFTVSAFALAGGASEVRLTREVDEALALAGRLPGAVVSAEVDGLPVPGVPISNSPTQVRDADLAGRVLVQRSSAGTQAMSAAVQADRRYAGSLVVAGATARAVLGEGPELVTLVASRPDHDEDVACARLLEGLLRRGGAEDVEELLEPLRASDRYRHLAAGRTPGFPPTDLELALAADRFDFAMPVDEDELGLRLRAVPA